MIVTLSKVGYLVEGHENKQLNVDDGYDKGVLSRKGFQLKQAMIMTMYVMRTMMTNRMTIIINDSDLVQSGLSGAREQSCRSGLNRAVDKITSKYPQNHANANASANANANASANANAKGLIKADDRITSKYRKNHHQII